MKRLLVITLLFLSLSCLSCHGYVIHPGAPNKTASVIYDELLVTDSIIKDARVLFTSGKLPDSGRPAFNTLVTTYNATRVALNAYTDAVGTSGYNPKLLDDLLSLRMKLSESKSAVQILMKGVK